MATRKTDPNIVPLFPDEIPEAQVEPVDIDAKIAAVAASGDNRNQDYDPTRRVSPAAEDQGWAVPEPKEKAAHKLPRLTPGGGSPGINPLDQVGDGKWPNKAEQEAAKENSGLSAARAALKNAVNKSDG